MATELKRASASLDKIEELLGADARALLDHTTSTISKDQIQLPGADFVDRVWSLSDRSPSVLRSLQTLYDNGRLAGTGYLSILPVDQGIEHSAGASFAPNPQYFDPDNIVKLAIEGGCNAVASTFGVLGIVARRYAHKIPFIVKINHNELLTYPNKFDQVMFGNVEQARDMGACWLSNSGGESKGASDMAEAVRTAVINKRGGGMGLISGRKAFQRPMNEGVELLNAIQDVYLSEEITVA